MNLCSIGNLCSRTPEENICRKDRQDYRGWALYNWCKSSFNGFWRYKWWASEPSWVCSRSLDEKVRCK